jgi:hypothetical protein
VAHHFGGRGPTQGNEGTTLDPNLSRIHHEFGSTLGEGPATLDRGRQASSVKEIT